MLCYREGELSHGAMVFCLGKGDGTVRYQNCNLDSMNLILLHILLRGAAGAHCWPNRAISRPGSTSIIRVSGPIANLRSDPAVLANTTTVLDTDSIYDEDLLCGNMQGF